MRWATVPARPAQLRPCRARPRRGGTPSLGRASATPSERRFVPAESGRTTTGWRHEPAVVDPGSKTTAVIELLQRKGGATLTEVMKVTGWQSHSVRGFLSGTLGKKMGLTVKSEKREDGSRAYSTAK